MSPEIGPKREIGPDFIFFEMGITDPEPFNPEEFDSLAKEVAFEIDVSNLKFVVVNEKMYIFGSDFSHARALFILNSLNISGIVECAGYLNINYEKM